MFVPIPENETERLEKLYSLDILDTLSEQEFDDLTMLAASICQVPISNISLIDRDRQWFKSTVGDSLTETPRDTAFCAHAIMQKDVMIVENALEDERFRENPFVASDPGIRFYAGAPLITSDGYALGTICVADTVPRELTDEQLWALRAISRQVLTLLEARERAAKLRRINQKLKNSEENYRLVAESASDAVMTVDDRGKIVFSNPATEDIFGYAPEDLIGENLTAIIPERVRLEYLSVFKEFLEAETIGESRSGVAIVALHKLGHEIETEISFGKSRLEKKVFTTVVIRDVTERNRAEENFRISESYRKLFQLASDAILILDLKTEEIIDVNDRACALYGFSRGEFIGKNAKDISRDAAYNERYLKELNESGQGQLFETVQYRADGTSIYLSINSSVIEYNGQKVILSINRDISKRKKAEEQLLHNAMHDGLTGLPNRALFQAHLRQALNQMERNSDDSFAVLFLDFDHFKVINDSLGHLEGDRLLTLIAQRLQASLRNTDIVARLGGDEFTVLLSDLESPNEALLIADRLQNDLKAPFKLSSREIFISASIGVALGCPGYEHPEEIMRDADIAMYRAKENGRARFQVFDQAMHRQANSRLQLESEIRRGIEKKEFCVFYQPIIDLRSDQVIGFEALLRWRHPKRGIVSPVEFIPLAEETGLIVPLGEFVLAESCRQLRNWQAANQTQENLVMSVNLSRKQFIQDNLAEYVAGVLRESKIPPETLRLEITESHFMEDGAGKISILERLRELGAKISVDDFGTGFSSLSYLHRLPIDFLKIDRSFTERMLSGSENGVTVQTIIMLAKNLNIEVVAEGIETAEQAAFLKNLGCDFGQGFFYSEPIDGEEAGFLINAVPSTNTIALYEDTGGSGNFSGNRLR